MMNPLVFASLNTFQRHKLSLLVLSFVVRGGCYLLLVQIDVIVRDVVDDA